MIIIQKDNTFIKNYTIVGERHSGTNLLQKLVTSYISLDLTWEYGWKHWIGFTDKNLLYNAKNTLFLCIIRNPYDWICGFKKQPYHVPTRNKKPWNNFLFNEWYSINDFSAREIMEDRNYLSKKRYKNIFELRQYKIHYIKQILPVLVNNYVLVTYEELSKNHTTIIDQIINRFQLKDKFINTNNTIVHEKSSYKIEKSILSLINNNIDWKTERTVGYEMIQDNGLDKTISVV